MTFVKDSSLWNTDIDLGNGNHIFKNMTDNRKRSREDDTCEFMPLSKRINNLHLNNNLINTSISQAQDSSQINGIPMANGISSPSSSETERPCYDPGINESESNYFYENKLLFELHLERLQRLGQQFPL